MNQFLPSFSACRDVGHVRGAVSPGLSRMIRHVSAPSATIPMPMPFPNRVCRAIVLLVPRVESVPFRRTKFVRLRMDGRIDFPHYLGLFFNCTKRDANAIFLFVILYLLPIVG